LLAARRKKARRVAGFVVSDVAGPSLPFTPVQVLGGYDLRRAGGGLPTFEDELPGWQERVEAARRTKERLGPLAAEKARKYEGLTLEQLKARWAEMMSRRVEVVNADDFEAEVMAIFSVLGVKMGERGKLLRAAGFENGEPMQ